MTALLAFRPRHRPGGWSPKELSTLSLWLDADDATTITIATGVSQWDDKSGNGRHMTQATGAAQPTWVKGAQNGRAVLRFNGTGHYLGGGDMLDFLTGGLSVAAVSINNDPSSGTIAADIICGKLAGTLAAGGYVFNRNGFAAHLGAVRESRDTTNPATWQVIVGTLDRQSGVATHRNGTQSGSSATGFPNTTSYDSSQAFQIGATTTPSAYLNGDLSELVLSLATWSTGDREKVEGYLAHKWGLAGSLPAGHTYKSAAP